MADEMQFTIENAEIAFRNFAGAEDQFNSKGTRTFLLILRDKKFAQTLIQDGWNVKYLKPKEEGDEEVACLSVTVRFDPMPPKIFMITSAGRTPIHEDTVEMLDYADIRTVDVIIRSYHWDVNGKSGIKAYLKTMFVTIEEDELERKYADAEG